MKKTPEELYTEILRNDFHAFAHRAWIELKPGVPLQLNWHIELISQALSGVKDGLFPRVAFNVPPRHLKSFLGSIAFPAWVLGHDSSKQLLSVTYGQDLSDTLARACRQLMQSRFYQAVFDTRIAPDRSAAADFETTEGGGRFATSVGGVLTGRGADVLIIDDPLKAEDAKSDLRRSAVNEWYDTSLQSRLNDPETGAIIILMQRLHIHDLVGHVVKNEPYRVLSLPAIATEPVAWRITTPYGIKVVRRKVGEVLHPARVSKERLDILKQANESVFSAHYQQQPQWPEGNIVKRAWLKYYEPSEKPGSFDQIVQSWDTATKDSELSSFSVCTTWGLKDRNFYLLDVFRKRLDFPSLKQALRSLAQSHRATVVLIEDKASGSSLLQQLRQENFSIAKAAPDLGGSKRIRLHGQTAQFENGHVLLPRGASWLREYENELLNFPNTQHDDQVDSTVYGLAWKANHSRFGWTREALQGLETFTNALAWDAAFGRLAGRPW